MKLGPLFKIDKKWLEKCVNTVDFLASNADLSKIRVVMVPICIFSKNTYVSLLLYKYLRF